MSAPAKTRFARKHWLALGMRIMQEDPQVRLTIDLLCQKAGKTKGSFYFHFKNMDSFLVALAEYWYEEFTLEVIRKSERQATPREKLDHLNTLAFQLDPRIEQGMRNLAAREPAIREICATVDDRRLAYLTGLYESTRRFDRPAAKALATIEYAAMVGIQQIMPDVPSKKIMAIYQEFLKLTGRG